MPESGEKTYYHWLENIEPWCISRQLWWGHQIPVWYGQGVGRADETGSLQVQLLSDELRADEVGSPGRVYLEHPICATSEALAKQGFAKLNRCQPEDITVVSREEYRSYVEFKSELYGYYFYAGSDGKVLIRDGLSLEEVNAKLDARFPKKKGIWIYRDPDVLDTWFSSGLWPIGTLGWPDQTPELSKYFPTSVLITGQDILFFWVARMMMMQLAVVNDIPFHTVYLHGLVRDAKGKKMSKSLGNVIDPLEIIDEYGADALRFANAAMASLGGVLKLDTQRIAGYRNFGTKLWNACRFAEMNDVWEGHSTQSAAPEAQATVNKWIIGETAKAAAEVTEALENYRFDQAADALYKFVWGKVCDWYVEFAKPLFDGDQAEETRATMAWVLDQSMILLHPMMPFITEELWATTGARSKLLVHTDWPDLPASLIDAAAMAEMTWVTSLIDDIRSARAQVHVPAGLKLALVATAMEDAARAAWANNEVLIKRIARIESLTMADHAPKGAITVAAEGA
ncbi:MAG: class I tRNA ligase family protein, partial [Rhodobacteraceae bacterium]|nr:class I tRNA ligase family protein [Paracoccaceae bacterium]